MGSGAGGSREREWRWVTSGSEEVGEREGIDDIEACILRIACFKLCCLSNMSGRLRVLVVFAFCFVFVSDLGFVSGEYDIISGLFN